MIDVLHLLFQKNWELGTPIPEVSRFSNIDASDLRPISVLSVVSKVMENKVTNRLMTVAEERGWLSDSQCGFRTRLRTLDNLSVLVGDVLKIWGERNPTCVAFLDGAASCSERVRSITDLIRPSYQPDEQQPENVDEQHDRQETEDRPLTYSILVVTGSSSLAAWTNP